MVLILTLLYYFSLYVIFAFVQVLLTVFEFFGVYLKHAIFDM